jgi:hypothetical protein
LADNPALAYQLEVQLHYIYNVSENWHEAIQAIGIRGEWVQCCDLPGMHETHTRHSRGALNDTDPGLVSSDDGGSDGGEVETAVDEDDHVDDLFENLPVEDTAETPEGDRGSEVNFV